MDTIVFSRIWEKKWPNFFSVPPREYDKSRWARFYMLPDGKRYPTNVAESETVLARHATLLKELNPSKKLTTIVSRWGHPQETEPGSNFQYWQTILEDPSDLIYRQLYIAELSALGEEMTGILKAVSEDEIDGVIFAPEDLSWLYCPYDGGVDIIASSRQQCQKLKETYKSWL